MKNKVFIATSIDGYIADKEGGIDWLDTIPEINTIDSGYHSFMDGIDALVMGRKTFETVLGFGIDWPYQKPVFVMSTSLQKIPPEIKGTVQLVKGTLKQVLEQIRSQGYQNLYIDGGGLIQSFLKEDLIDEMIITVIPILLGDGYPLFGELPNRLQFKCVATKHFLDAIVQNHYIRNLP